MADAGADQYTFHLEATGKKNTLPLTFMPLQTFITIDYIIQNSVSVSLT